MKKEKIWIVSEMFYPDETSTAYIMTSIAECLSNDTDVHILCGPAGYDRILEEKTQALNFTVHRIKAFNFDKNQVFQRLVRISLISFGMFFFGLFRIKSREKVLLVTNPALAIPLFSLLKKIKNFRYTILVHDVFPENLVPAGIVKSKNVLAYRILTTIFNWSYKKADHLIVLGRDMKEIMESKTENETEITIIENWADLENVTPEPYGQNKLIKEKGLEDKIVFLFAGNLGRLQALPFLFEIIKEVQNDAVHFAFVGSGALLPELTRQAEVENLTNISFWGAFPRESQQLFLNASHFGVVTLDQEVYGLGVPSKSYNILAAGKPIFFIGNRNSEIAILIENNSCGLSFEQIDKSHIVTFINQLSKDNISKYTLKGESGRTIVQQHYSKDLILSKFKSVLSNNQVYGQRISHR